MQSCAASLALLLMQKFNQEHAKSIFLLESKILFWRGIFFPQWLINKIACVLIFPSVPKSFSLFGWIINMQGKIIMFFFYKRGGKSFCFFKPSLGLRGPIKSRGKTYPISKIPYVGNLGIGKS